MERIKLLAKKIYSFRVDFDKILKLFGFYILETGARKIGIISLSVLSHHPAYRSVQGGSLSFDSNHKIVICQRYIACFSKSFRSDGGAEDVAVGCVPLAFPCVCPLPSFGFVCSRLDQVFQFGSYPFPLFPDVHPDSFPVPPLYP